jgi:hypothetical protein
MADSTDYEIMATDVTLSEAYGNYDRVVQIMNTDANYGKPMPKNKKPTQWVLRSNIGINNSFGYNEIVCQFKSDRSVDILQYEPIIRDVFYNIDIRCFAHWCWENGWSRPEPAPDLIRTKPDFWKHQWQSYVVDSAYLESKFGKRADDVDEPIEEDDD